MYQRYVVNSLLRNTDDNLRNHAFIGDADGWRLSPAFDVVPHIGQSAHVCAAAPGVGHQWDPCGTLLAHRPFGIDTAMGEGIHEQARAAFLRLREFMDAREVTAPDRALVLGALVAGDGPVRATSGSRHNGTTMEAIGTVVAPRTP